MMLRINVNGEITSFSIEWVPMNTFKRCVEFLPDSDTLRIYNYNDYFTLSNTLFNMITHYSYNIVIQRVQDVASNYDVIENLKACRSWLLDGKGVFLLNNVNICMDDVEMRITMLIPHTATVSRETRDCAEELTFKHCVVIDNELLSSID